jgi:hypothetical protein
VNPRIAILGRDSILWDASTEFDEHHDQLEFYGPTLPLEFSRISTSQNGGLTAGD